MKRSAADGVRSYNGAAKFLHRSIAILIVLQLGIGGIMPPIHKDTRPEGEIAWHIAVGVLIVLLAATHLTLYALMVIVPVLGWANAGARDWAVGIGPFQPPACTPSFGSPCARMSSLIAPKS